MKTYKTPERVRRRALQYYWDHKAEVLMRMEAYRRTHGVAPQRPAKTEAEKLAAKVMCVCGRQITTPSQLLKSQRKCLRCARPRHYTTEAYRLRSQQHRRSLTSAHGRFWAWKEQQVCVECGTKHSKAHPLDFHHRDPTTKLFKISRGLHRVSATRLWAEIAKCEVLCKPCHKARHQ